MRSKCIIKLVLLCPLAALVGMPAVAQASPPLRIGVIFPFTGKQARQGELGRVGIELAIRESSGFHPQIFYEDSQSDSNQAVAAFHSLRSKHQVDVVLTMGSPQAMALLPLANKTQTVLLAMVVASGFSSPDDYGFRLMGTAAGFADRIAQLLRAELERSRIALVYVEDDYGIAYEKVLREKLGPNLVATQAYLPATSDFRASLLKIKASAPDAVILASWAVEAGVLLRQIKEIGLRVPVVVCPSACDNPDVVISAAGAIDPLVVVASSSETTSVRTKTLLDISGQAPTSVVLRFFDAISLLLPAFERCKDAAGDRPECLRKAIAATNDFPGSSYRVQFDSNGDIVDRYQLKVAREGTLVSAKVNSRKIIIE